MLSRGKRSNENARRDKQREMIVFERTETTNEIGDRTHGKRERERVTRRKHDPAETSRETTTRISRISVLLMIVFRRDAKKIFLLVLVIYSD